MPPCMRDCCGWCTKSLGASRAIGAHCRRSDAGATLRSGCRKCRHAALRASRFGGLVASNSLPRARTQTQRLAHDCLKGCVVTFQSHRGQGRNDRAQARPLRLAPRCEGLQRREQPRPVLVDLPQLCGWPAAVRGRMQSSLRRGAHASSTVSCAACHRHRNCGGAGWYAKGRHRGSIRRAQMQHSAAKELSVARSETLLEPAVGGCPRVAVRPV